jgi:LAS superfamily LD-carboxypeptidase LdcB
MHYFLDPSLRTTGSHLRDLAAQVADETLRSRITTVADTWDSVVKDAPSSGLRFSAPGTESTASRVQRQTDGNRLERQTQSARMGIEQCQTALERLNEISLS